MSARAITVALAGQVEVNSTERRTPGGTASRDTGVKPSPGK